MRLASQKNKKGVYKLLLEKRGRARLDHVPQTNQAPKRVTFGLIVINRHQRA